MRVLVCGDRHWDDLELLQRELLVHAPTLVIHGGARGADSLAGVVAHRLKLPFLEFKAEWAKYGRAAGPLRNQRMLDEGKPDLVLAFHDDLDQSKGTKNMIQLAKRAGVSVRLVQHPKP